MATTYDIPEAGISCEVVWTETLGGPRRAIGVLAQAYAWRGIGRVLRVVAAHEAPPLTMIPVEHRERLSSPFADADEERYLVWYDDMGGTGGRMREEHGALVDALIADYGIAGEVAR
jgi:hypothetical protein